MTVGCLGSANSWFTLPLLTVIGALGILALVSPKTANRLPGVHRSPALTRLGGAVTIGIAVVMGSLALHEARTDPACRLETSVATPTTVDRGGV